MKFISKFKSLSAPVKASIVFFLCNLIQKGIAFCIVPIYTRMMSSAEYGQYSLFLSWYTVISVFATFNLSYHVFNKGLLKFEKNREEFTSSMLGLSTVLTFVCIVIYTCFYQMFNGFFKLTTFQMILMFSELLLAPAFEYWSVSQRFEYKYKKIAVLTVGLSLLTPAIGIPMIFMSDEKGTAAIIGKALASCLIYIIPYIIIVKNSKHFYDKQYWKYALAFNIPLIPHFLSAIILQQSDRLMIRNFCGEAEVGIYSIAYSLSMVVTILNTSVLNTFIPWTYKKLKDKSYKEIGSMSNILYMMIMIIDLLLIIVAPELISVLGPSEYHNAVYVVPPLVASCFAMFIMNLFINVEYFFEETKFGAVATVLAAVVNIILNYFCIRKFGYIAAGYTTFASYLIYAYGHYFFMKLVQKRNGVNCRIYNMKLINTSMVFILICTVLMNFLYKYLIIRYALLLIVICLVVKNIGKFKQVIVNLKKGD